MPAEKKDDRKTLAKMLVFSFAVGACILTLIAPSVAGHYNHSGTSNPYYAKAQSGDAGVNTFALSSVTDGGAGTLTYTTIHYMESGSGIAASPFVGDSGSGNGVSGYHDGCGMAWKSDGTPPYMPSAGASREQRVIQSGATVVSSGLANSGAGTSAVSYGGVGPGTLSSRWPNPDPEGGWMVGTSVSSGNADIFDTFTQTGIRSRSALTNGNQTFPMDGLILMSDDLVHYSAHYMGQPIDQYGFGPIVGGNPESTTSVSISNSSSNNYAPASASFSYMGDDTITLTTGV